MSSNMFIIIISLRLKILKLLTLDVCFPQVPLLAVLYSNVKELVMTHSQNTSGFTF